MYHATSLAPIATFGAQRSWDAGGPLDLQVGRLHVLGSKRQVMVIVVAVVLTQQRPRLGVATQLASMGVSPLLPYAC